MNFNQKPKKVEYAILCFTTIKYDITLKNTLSNGRLLQLLRTENQQPMIEPAEPVESE